MKQNRQIPILVVLLIITTVCGLYFFVQKRGIANQELSTTVATDFSMGEVQGLVVKNAAGTIALINTPGGVILQDDEENQYAQNKLKTLVYTISHLTAQRQISSTEAAAKEFGIADPLAQVSILLPESTVRLKLGRQNPISEEYYLSVEGNDTLYMIDSDTANLMLQSTQDLRELSLYPSLTNETISDIAQIKITNDNGSFTLCPMTSNNAGVFFGLVSPVEVMLDWERVDSRVLNPLRELYPEKFVSDDVSLSEYGLDQPDITLELTMDGQIYRSGFVQKDPDTWYCADLNGTLVSQVSTNQVTFLQTDFMDLIGNSIYSKSVADISRISFKYSGQSLALDISGESTELSCTVNGLQMDQKELLDFYEKIDSIPASGLLDGTETIAQEPLLTISISFRNGGEDILEFYAITQRQCAVYINGVAEFSTYTMVADDMISAANLLKQKSENK